MYPHVSNIWTPKNIIRKIIKNACKLGAIHDHMSAVEWTFSQSKLDNYHKIKQKKYGIALYLKFEYNCEKLTKFA